MNATGPAILSAREAAKAIRGGELTAAALMEACLYRIAAREPDVQAWSFLNPELALSRARLADAWQAAGLPLGLLHGLPVGIKDVFDTVDMPSEYGSAMLRGRRPAEDADAVTLLRRAGAIVVGKTTTSEFGMYHPSPTRNPRDLARSPGVSSAGAAAAVVDHMVPLALGTQHTASTTLPASFCGAFAFKPSRGLTSMHGSNVLVPRLANVGLLARSVSDLALFASAYDPRLDDIGHHPRPARLGIVRGPGWSTVSRHARDGFDAFICGLQKPVREVGLPGEFDGALEIVIDLLNAHLAWRFGSLPQGDLVGLCQPLRDGVAAGQAMGAVRYLELDTLADRLTSKAVGLFAGCDALITLSAPGEATLLTEGPGSGVMSMPWSLCGLPTVSLPLLIGSHGMPIGVQLIGPASGDRELLQTASWLMGISSRRSSQGTPFS